MTDCTPIEITGGVRVCCPPDPGLMTRYVFEERQDWFEDELRFLRVVAEADSVMLDIGANYGVYALSIAALAVDGEVVAYEPAAATAECLRQGIATNGFDHVTLHQAALSDTAGEGRLRITSSPELNMLVDGDGDAGADGGESVALTTLDAEYERHGWSRVDIVKLAAEGHEARIVDGGRAFFERLSPLVLCEIKTGRNVDLAAAQRLLDLGYAPYLLIPGLQTLIPQRLDNPLDPFQLNLLLCKADRADILRARERLVDETVDDATVRDAAKGRWHDHLYTFVYGRKANKRWINRIGRKALAGWRDHELALDLFALSQDAAQPMSMRFSALRAAYSLINALTRQMPTAPRLLSTIRIATEIGARGAAVQAMKFFLANIGEFRPQDFDNEPGLSPSMTFDAITPGAEYHQWAIAGVLDAHQRLGAFSSYFTDPKITIAVADDLERMGYLTPEMARRRTLAQRRV